MDETTHLTESQHGAVHRRQLTTLGLTRSAVDHAIRRGRWVPLGSGVLRLAGAPCTPEQAAMSAVLAHGPDAALSHASAFALWGFPGFRLEPAHVTRTRRAGRRRKAVGHLHDTTYLPSHHVTEVDGIPGLTPTRLLFQLAATARPERVTRLTDTAWARRLVSGRSLHEMCGELSEHGRDGMTVMRQVLADRPVGYLPPESNLEARVQRIARDHGLPELRRQVHLGGREWLGRVDFKAVDAPLVVFVDGERWHSSPLDRAADARQQAELEAAGLVVVRICERDVWHDVPAVVASLGAGWLQARRLAG